MGWQDLLDALARPFATTCEAPGPSWHPAGRWVEVLGRRVHVVDVGRGPSVLLLHGFLHASWTWRHVVAALAPRHRVIVPCLPGWGWSDRRPGDRSLEASAAVVDALLDALGVERLALAVGNSLGGGIVLRHALDAPGRAERLLLVSPLALPIPVPSAPLRLLASAAFAPLFRATAANPGLARLALGLLAYRAVDVDDAIWAGFAPLARPGTHVTACETAGELLPSSLRLAPRLGEVQAPATLVWGGRDRVLPLAYGRAVAERLGAPLEVLDACGHCPQEEDPARFLALVAAALADVEPGPVREVRRAA